MNNSRRAKGAGNVTPLANGKFKVMVSYYANGKKHNLSRNVERAKVQETLMELQRKCDTYSYAVKPDMPFALLADKWLREKEQDMLRRENPLKLRTYEGYKGIVKILKKELPYIKVCRISESVVNKLKQELEKIHKSSSLRKDFLVLNQIIRLGMREHIITVNPVSNIRLPRVSKQVQDKILGTEDVMAMEAELLNKYNSHRGNKSIFDWHLYPIVTLALDSGMRNGEIAGLAVEDIDFTSGRVYVHTNATAPSSGKVSLGTTKTEAGTRRIYISNNTLKVLSDYLNAKRAAGYKDSPLVFSTRNGTPIAPNRLSRAFTKVREALKLNKAITFHALRHTAITRMLKQGIQLKVVSARVGHADTSTTQNVYNHVTDEDQRGIADSYEQWLEAQKKAGGNRMTGTVLSFPPVLRTAS